MKTRKNITCILLCLGMLLAMTACGNSGNAESTESVEIASAADAYLTMAQEFVAQENYDSAVEVLNKAKATLEDSRLDAMLAEIEAARQSVLTVEYQVNDSNLKTQGVEIHSVEAQILEQTVRYTVGYTAPAGMYLQVVGTDTGACWDYRTPGGQDTFSFELDQKTASSGFQELTVLLKYSYQNYLQLDITTCWPDAAPYPLVEIPVINSSNAVCSVDSVTVRAVSENLLHFQVDYTTPKDQQYLVGLSLSEAVEDTFFSIGVAPGKDMISFMMERKEMESIDAIYIRLFPQEQEDNALLARIRSADYTLPQYSAPTESQELFIDNSHNKELPVTAEKGKKLQLDNVRIMQTAAGNLYTLTGDFSETSVNTAYCDIGRLKYTVTMQTHTPNELQFFLPADLLTQTIGLGIEFWGPKGYIGNVPMAYDFVPASVTVLHPKKGPEAVAEGAAPGQILQYPTWGWENTLTHSEVEIFGVTETLLDNGNLRYELEYRATAGMQVVAFDPPNGELYSFQRQQTTSGGREFFAFEIEKSVLDQLQYITVNFFSENDEGNYWVYLEKYWYYAAVTDGNPIGEPQTIKTRANSKVKIHSLTAQQLDNDYIRFTLEYTTSPGRSVSFFNQPNNDHFIYLKERIATGGQDTYVIDVPKADIDDISEITMKFYDLSIGDHVFAWFDAPRF